MRVSSQLSSKRKLSAESVRILDVFEHWLLHMSPFVSMRPASVPLIEARADASAQGQQACIGGYVYHPQLGQRWFREQYSYEEFRQLGIPVQSDMQLDIACYETLAQSGLIVAASELLPSSRVTIRLHTQSDNTGAEAGINSALTTAKPLCYFLERIALLAAMHRAVPDVSHTAGERNVKADALSRPDEYDVPSDCVANDRLRLPLKSLWLPRPTPHICPEGASLCWAVRESGMPSNPT
ncbi:unnamed protein product [Symbiodinium sp. CCMP2592]|nr:unnamed protein product [Symbiodinium sp. CCMP2592]